MFNNQYNNNNFINYNLINYNTFNNLNINNHLFYNNYNNNINNTWPFISKHPNLNDFIEIKNLGNGANGSVIKVQNKIIKLYYDFEDNKYRYLIIYI